MWGIPGEDEYWERRREEYENPRRRYDEEKVIERDRFYLDEEEEQEEIEGKYGCAISKLSEGDLLDIVLDFIGIEAESAEWDDKFQCIEYWY